MRVFVVRLNPDPRPGPAYSKYVTEAEYQEIHESSPMDGFEEAVNFLPEKGVIRGYLPPKHLKAIRTGEPFALVTITAKTAGKRGDLIVGLQAGCVYAGSQHRSESEDKRGYRNLIWTYLCDEGKSILLKEPIAGARGLVLGDNGVWVRGPTLELKGKSIARFARSLENSVRVPEDKKMIKRWSSFIASKGRKAKLHGHLADIDDHSFLSPEGRQKLVVHKARERNTILVASKKASVLARKGALVCEVCNFDFQKFYGELGDGYGEVHHLKPLSKGGERKTSLSELAILCANCHRMIHRTEPMMSVEQFRLELSRKGKM
jgi:hypothetical protein